MNFELTKEQQMISKSASDFAKATLEPIAFDEDRSAEYPSAAVKEMGKNDFLGMTIPVEFGGTGADFVSVALMAEAFGKANAAVASIAIAHNVLAAQTISMYGSDAQKKNYLPALASGDKIGGYAFVEPGAALASGPDKLVAVKDGGSYKLNGKKTFAANGGKADVYVVIAQTNEEAGQKGVSAFIVDAADVKVVKAVDKLGLRSFPTAELEFANTKAELLGKEEDGAKIMAETQARFDIANCAMAAGIAKAALDASTDHCKTRVQFGAPIGRLQAVQWLLSEIALNAHMIKMTAFQAAAIFDAKGNYIQEAAFTKMYTMTAAVDAGMNAVQIHGGTGYSREAKIERYFRDLRGSYNIENVNEFPQKIIASALLK